MGSPAYTQQHQGSDPYHHIGNVAMNPLLLPLNAMCGLKKLYIGLVRAHKEYRVVYLPEINIVHPPTPLSCRVGVSDYSLRIWSP